MLGLTRGGEEGLTRGGFLGKEPARGMCHPFAALRACPERSEGMTHRPSASFDSQNVFFEMYWPLSWSYERLSPPPRATQASPPHASSTPAPTGKRRFFLLNLAPMGRPHQLPPSEGR